MIYTKINATEVKEIVTRPDIEVIHNLDDLLEKQAKIKEEIAVQEQIVIDLQTLIDEARKLGVCTKEEIKAQLNK